MSSRLLRKPNAFLKKALLKFDWESKTRIKEKYLILVSVMLITLILSSFLSNSAKLRKNSISLAADTGVLAEELISELGPTENLTCEKTLTDATLSCQNYYDNLIDVQKPEDFLNVYLVEDSEFIFGTQNTSGQIVASPTDRNQLMTYIVQKGDTLGKIAEQFGVSLDTIRVANRLNKDVLTPGKELIILPVSGIYYTIKKGDTLGRIASVYKISVSSILEYNGINEKYIKIGDKIILPGAKNVVETTKPSSATQITNTGSSSGYYIYPTTGWNWGQLHNNNAVDIANSCGTPVYAAANGIIITASKGSWNGGYGNFIKIQHPNGTTTLYAHLSSINIENGASVKQGDFIGKMGSTGKSTGCHLHFEVSGAKNPFIK